MSQINTGYILNCLPVYQCVIVKKKFDSRAVLAVIYLATINIKVYLVLALVAMVLFTGREWGEVWDTQQENFNTKLAAHKYNSCNDDA